MKKITITEYKNIMKSMKIEEIYIEYSKGDKIKLEVVGEMKESKSNQAPAWFIEFKNADDKFKTDMLEFKSDMLEFKSDMLEFKDAVLSCPTIKKEIDHSKLNKLS